MSGSYPAVVGAPVSGRWRGVRGGVVATTAALLAAAGHTLGGGAPPDLALLLPAAAGVGVVASGFARRRLTFPTLLALLSAAQIACHALFTLSAHPSAVTLSLQTMVVFHLVAAVVTALVLTGAEGALYAVLAPARITRLLITARPAGLGHGVSWTAILPEGQITVRPAPARSPAPRRGPPIAV